MRGRRTHTISGGSKCAPVCLLCPRRGVSPWSSPAWRSRPRCSWGARHRAAAAPSSGLVVNEVYGGGGNSGATYTNDFIELRNRGTAAVEPRRLVGAVPLRPARRGSWQVTPLSGSIAPGAIYLVAEAAGTGGTQPLPDPAGHRHHRDVGHGRHGRRRQRHRGADLQRLRGLPGRLGRPRRLRHGGHQRDGPRGRRVQHRLGAAQGRGRQRQQRRRLRRPAPRPPAPPTSAVAAAPATAIPARCASTTSRTRAGSPRTTASRSPTCPASSPPSAPTGSSRGYWIQDPDPDSSAATSEGIFVFTSSPGRGGRRLGARVGHRPRLLSAVERRLRRHHLEPVGDRDRDPDGHRALARQRAAGARGHRAGHGARRLRPGPQRRQHRVDADHAEPLGPRLLGVARGHARGGRRRPRGRPVQQLRRAVRHHQAGAGDHLPRRHRDPGRERHPLGPRRGRAGQRRQPRRRRGRRVLRRHGRARSTTRSSAAT